LPVGFGQGHWIEPRQLQELKHSAPPAFGDAGLEQTVALRPRSENVIALAHVGEHQFLSAKMVRHRPTNSCSNNSTKHQARSNETDYIGMNLELSDDDGHRHAKNENGITIE